MSISWEKDDVKKVIDDMNSYYKYANLYQVFIPTYASGHYSFCFCSHKIDPINTPFNYQKFTEKKIKTDYYNKDIHLSSFNLPNEFIEKSDPKSERLGTSYMINVKNCSFDNLNNYPLLNKMLILITEMYNLKIISSSYKIFKPQGVTICILLEESHISIHTWPEKGKCAIDLFSCSEFKWKFNNNNNNNKIDILTILKKYLEIKSSNIMVRFNEREI